MKQESSFLRKGSLPVKRDEGSELQLGQHLMSRNESFMFQYGSDYELFDKYEKS